MAVPLEAYPETRAQLSLIPRETQVEEYDIASELPPEILIGDPLPQVLADMYFAVIPPQEYGFERWEFDTTPRNVKQISSTTLRSASENAVDSTRLYVIRSATANGQETRYEAEAALSYLDGWSSNRRDYLLTGMVRISGFSPPVDAGLDDAPVMDAASVQLSYDGNRFMHAHMLRSNAGSHIGSGGEVLQSGEIVSFNNLRERERYSQQLLAGFEDLAHDKDSGLLIVPSVRVEGNTAVMMHYGKPYEVDGNTVLQAIEIRTPYDITGLAPLIEEQGTYDEEENAEGEMRDGEAEDALDFMPMTEVFKAATQFPVSIKTTVVSIK